MTDTEADLSSVGSRSASRQVSCDVSRDTAELVDFKPSSSFKAKMKNNDSGIFERVETQLFHRCVFGFCGCSAIRTKSPNNKLQLPRSFCAECKIDLALREWVFSKMEFLWCPSEDNSGLIGH